jgi:hypothetical protein
MTLDIQFLRKKTVKSKIFNGNNNQKSTVAKQNTQNGTKLNRKIKEP